MKLADAVKLAGKSDDIRGLKNEGFFLNSAMAFLEPADNNVGVWNLTYYEAKSNQVAQIVVEKESVYIKERGTPMNPTKQVLDLMSIKTSEDKMLAKAQKEFGKYKQPVSQVIINLVSENDMTQWKINFITKMLYLITIILDAKTGELLSSSMHSLSK
jgi:hypothetical protein